MANLQFLKGQKHLFNLVCFGLSFMILDIDPWITLPGGFVNSMAACASPGFPKESFAYFA